MKIADFAMYDGADQFVYQGKQFRRLRLLGTGSFADVYLFQEVGTNKQVCVKTEKCVNHQYALGHLFENESCWYEKVYGMGVLSGDPNDLFSPCHIILPYFAGMVLHEKKYSSERELYFYWILTAVAVKALHEKHQVIHGDIKSDNVIVQEKKVCLIDFGFSTRVGKMRAITFDAEDRLFIRHQAPELFVDGGSVAAAITQDIYCLGSMLRNMFYHFFLFASAAEGLSTARKKVENIAAHMMHEAAQSRWSIQKSVYLLSMSCLSQLPKPFWNKIVLDESFARVEVVFSVVIQDRINVLTAELEGCKWFGARKREKIAGLKKLREAILKKPTCALEYIVSAKNEKPVIVGLFSHRTQTMLSEMNEVATALRLVQ